MTRLFATLCVLAAALAHAEEPGLDELRGLLDTGVVTAPSRANERADDAPATVTVVTSDELRKYGLRSLHEVINFLSVGMLAQDPLHAVEVGARGVLLTADYGNHVLLVIDGHVMNEAWNGTAYFEQGLGIPLEFIDHVELIVGPGSVLYGSSAMLGVINVVTRRPRDLGRVQLTVEGSLVPPQGADGAPQLRAGFGGTGRVSLLSGVETSLAGAPFSAALALEYFAHRGQSLTFGVQRGLTEGDGTTSWPQRWGARAPAPGEWGGVTTDSWWTQAPSALLKVQWGDFSLWVRGALYGRGAPAYDSFGIAANFDARNGEVDRWLDAELRWQHPLSARVGLSARAYFDLYDYLASYEASSWQTYGSDAALPGDATPDDFTFRQEIRAGSRWGGLELQGHVDWLGDGRFPLLVGVDARLRSFHDRTVSATLDGQLFDESNAYAVDEWQVAAYLQQRARLLPSLQLNAGVRVDTQSAFAPRPSPRAAVVWTTPWEARVKLVFSTAFRTPSGYERFAQYAGYQVRNPALQPETVMTGELSYEQRFGRHRVAVIGFASSFQRLVQLLELPDDASLHAYQNHGEILSHGAQGVVEGSLGAFSYAASFTGAFNTTADATPLPASPTWFGNARVSWAFGADRPTASLLANFSAPRPISTAAATSVDGVPWQVTASSGQVELRAAVEGRVKQVPGLWWRAVVGGQVAPFSAYVVGPRQSPDDTSATPALSPNSRLFGLVTLGWSY